MSAVMKLADGQLKFFKVKIKIKCRKKEGKHAITEHCYCLLASEFQCQRKGFIYQLLIVSYGNYNTP